MKTNKCIAWRLLSAVLAFLLVLTTALPVFAAENKTIEIKNAKGLPAMKVNQFAAYQLFSGTPNKESADAEHNVWDAASWDNYTLADIQWGKDVKGPALITALQALTYETNGKDYPYLFAEGTHANLFAGLTAGAADSAEQLARLLVGKENAFLQEFSKFVVGKGAGEDDSYLNATGAKSTVTAGAGTAADGSDDVSSITVPATGYYLVVEEGNDAEAVSEYILAVLGDQTINLKTSLPVVQKWIDKSGTKGKTACIGDMITFILEGTLPADYEDFLRYTCVFHDTLAAGLSFDEATAGLKVEIGGHVLTKDDQYTVKTTGMSDGCNLEIAVNDLKTFGFADVDAASKITVTYQAKLDQDAVLGSTGNQNNVVMEYPIDINHAGTARTAASSAWVYTFGFDLKKTGSDKPDGLGGAGFLLKNEAGQYAKFETVSAGRRFAGWTGDTAVNGLVTTYRTAKEAWDKASYADQTNPASAVSETLTRARAALADYLLTSSSDAGSVGKIPTATGLGEGTYTLTEIITPAGYNTMKDFTLQITPAIATTGALQSFTYVPDGAAPGTTYSSTSTPAVYNSGLISQTLVNQKAALLPFTGGTGTLIFYISGGLLIAGALTYIIVAARKRKSA